MPISGFDHVNVLTDDTKATRDFFVTVLGVEEGPRPPFRSSGYWLYHDGAAIIHISDVRNHEQTHAGDGRRGGRASAGRQGVDHLAFRCTDYSATKQRLAELRLASHEADVPEASLRQVFVDGPGGVTLELIFTARDVAAATARDAQPTTSAAS